jgi:rSAM/selenodomain-associated transferase 1
MKRSSHSLLVVMSKEPVAGKVKTRLQPELSPAEAADLYRCFLQDRLEEMTGLKDVDTAVAYDPPSSAESFASLVPASFRLFPQRGEGLSERLDVIFSDAFAEGYGAVSIVDSDSPDLPKAFVLESFRLLRKEADVVFGPCRDGGYYLVGMNARRGGVFDGIPWSSSGVLHKSVERAESLGLRVSLLPPWQDIDTFGDLRDFYSRRDLAGTGPSTPGSRTMALLAGKKFAFTRGGG